MMFQYCRTIRFQDTDAAGVVYFAQILSVCHEAYEASLQQTGIDLQAFFSRGAIAVPITHAEADFHRPLMCGDVITIRLTPQSTSPHSFNIQYEICRGERQVASAATHHVCIDTATRQRCPLTSELTQWLQVGTEAAESPTGAGQLD
ncbi:MAG: acyl-CoA thioesterase [Leptolyngbya sp. SIO1E4]|nr:acyl-CoA thioesterase [Leptolyngbya sp. SIO1E4]